MSGLFDALESSPILAGFCYTQLTDTRQETNGLADENRNPKLPLEVIRGFVISSARQSGQIRPRTIVEASAVLGTDERSAVSLRPSQVGNELCFHPALPDFLRGLHPLSRGPSDSDVLL